MANLVDQSAISRLYQTGQLSSQGVSDYQLGPTLMAASFRGRSAATYAYQHGMLTGEGLLAYQRGQLGAKVSWYGFETK